MKNIEYTCCRKTGKRTLKWLGRIKIISEGNPIEAEVCARGSSFHVLVGVHSYGNYICVPNWNVGAELAELRDVFWNRESLLHAGLKTMDACSVADAVAAIGDAVGL